MYAVQALGRFGSRLIALAPDGLYASPDWDGALEKDTLVDILAQLTTLGTRQFTWNVRFDHEPLAAGLAALGLAATRNMTQILELTPGYERVFAGFNSTTRNHIRKGLRRGVQIRPVSDIEDVRAYYEIHKHLAQQQGYGSIYPLGLLIELAKLDEFVRFLVAESEGHIVSGGIFFRDGCSVMYWHGASDRSYSQYFPGSAVLAEAIRWACEADATTFNFGASAGIASLEHFKAAWGARQATNWQFTWKNQYWTVLRGGAALARRLTSPFR